MIPRNCCLLHGLLVAIVVPLVIDVPTCTAQSVAAARTASDQSGAETLTRGPLHEAFAEQLNFNAQAGLTVPKSPPEPVDEVPPDVQPDGNNVQWIPGYWAWEDDRDDFIWVSGVWRDIPPDRQWVPGYWAEVDRGYQWIAGFWTAAGANDVVYLPYPPNSLERGPTSPQPSVNHYWVSGCWQHSDQRYRWRPGYWVGHRNDWIWTPDHYVWTPRGAVYVRGYWDYPLARRGVAFAPIYFHQHIYRQAHYRYSPSVVINVSHLLLDLFVQPHHHHYYWGDYYGDRYRRAGYQPNFAFHGRTGFDPLFTYQNIHQRQQGIDFDSRVREWHADREHDESHRPPRTFKEQQERTDRDGHDAPTAGQVLTKSLRDVIGDRQGEVRLHPLKEGQQASISRHAVQLRELADQRNLAEALVADRVDAGTPSGEAASRSSIRFKLPNALEAAASGRARVSPPQSQTQDEQANTRTQPKPSEEVRPALPDRSRDATPNRTRQVPQLSGADPAVQPPATSSRGEKDRGQPPSRTHTDQPNQPPVSSPVTPPNQPAPRIKPFDAPVAPPTQPAPTVPRNEPPADQRAQPTIQSRLNDFLNRGSSAPNPAPRSNSRPTESRPSQDSPPPQATPQGNSPLRAPSAPPQQPNSNGARKDSDQLRRNTNPIPNTRSVEPPANRGTRFERPPTQPRIDTRRPSNPATENTRAPSGLQRPKPQKRQGDGAKKPEN